MANRYLEGVSTKQPKTVRVLLLWVCLIVMFLAIWQFLSPTAEERGSRRPARRPVAAAEARPAASSPMPTGMILCVVVVAFGSLFAYSLKKQGGMSARIRGIESNLLEENIDAAEAEARLALKTALGQQRFVAVYLLGQCAERRGDFREAAEIYALAPKALPAAIGTDLVRMQLEPLADARRAFVLAAADRLDEAETIVARPLPPQAMPGTLALIVRARAVIDSKRGRYKELLDGLTASRATLRDTLSLRDRILLRAVVAHAHLSIADAHRGAGTPSVLADPALAHWIARVVPRVQPLLEEAS